MKHPCKNNRFNRRLGATEQWDNRGPKVKVDPKFGLEPEPSRFSKRMIKEHMICAYKTT